MHWEEREPPIERGKVEMLGLLGHPPIVKAIRGRRWALAVAQ